MAWLGNLDWVNPGNILNIPKTQPIVQFQTIVHLFPLSLKKYWRKVQGTKIIRILSRYMEFTW